MYRRPWAKNSEKYYEQGMKRPDQDEGLFIFDSRRRRSRSGYGALSGAALPTGRRGQHLLRRHQLFLSHEYGYGVATANLRAGIQRAEAAARTKQVIGRPPAALS